MALIQAIITIIIEGVVYNLRKVRDDGRGPRFTYRANLCLRNENDFEVIVSNTSAYFLMA